LTLIWQLNTLYSFTDCQSTQRPAHSRWTR